MAICLMDCFLTVFIFVWWFGPRLLEPDLVGSVQHGGAVLESEGPGEEGNRLSASGFKLCSSPHEGTNDLITSKQFSLVPNLCLLSLCSNTDVSRPHF